MNTKSSPKKIRAMREWRRLNREKTRARSRRVHELHMIRMANDPDYRAKVQAKERNYRIRNREKIRAYARDYWQKNRDAWKIGFSLGIPIAEARQMLASPASKSARMSLPNSIIANTWDC